MQTDPRTLMDDPVALARHYVDTLDPRLDRLANNGDVILVLSRALLRANRIETLDIGKLAVAAHRVLAHPLVRPAIADPTLGATPGSLWAALRDLNAALAGGATTTAQGSAAKPR